MIHLHIQTKRLKLVAGSLALSEAELYDHEKFAHLLNAQIIAGLSLKGAEKQEFEGCITPPASNLGRDPSSLGRGSYSTAWL